MLFSTQQLHPVRHLNRISHMKLIDMTKTEACAYAFVLIPIKQGTIPGHPLPYRQSQ